MCVYEDHLKDRLPIAMAVSIQSYNTIINSLPKNTANQLQYKGQNKEWNLPHPQSLLSAAEISVAGA
jgi:hypothetical protein